MGNKKGGESGLKKIMDGNFAVAYISYGFSEVVGLFPITPSSKMAELVEEWSGKNKTNIFDDVVTTTMMESEASVAGSMHGLLKSGILTTSFTSSQGLLLMIPALYKMAGELLPGVLHVASRSIATSSLNIHGDHSDVMAVRQTGAVMLSSGSVQEAALFAAVAHQSAIQGRLPIVHFFDGFDTSHEVRKINVPTYDELKRHVDSEAIDFFKSHSMSNFSPRVSGSIQSPDLYFQQREAGNIMYQAMEKLVEQSIEQFNPLFGTKCSTVDYYGSPEATSVIVLMGSAQEIVKEAIDSEFLKSKKIGVVTIHMYRPFPKKKFLDILPTSVAEIAVLDRTKEPGATGEPLLLDVQKTCSESERKVNISGGRYGLGGKKITVSQICRLFSELEKTNKKNEFTLGITDDVTKLSLSTFDLKQKNNDHSLLIEFLGLGGDGAISGAKDFIKLIGENTLLDIKADFEYPASKARDLTIGRLLVSNQKIQSTDYEEPWDFIVCDQLQYLNNYQPLEQMKNNGVLILNYSFTADSLEKQLSNAAKRSLAKKNIELYVLPANKIARKFELGPKINTLMVSALLSKINLLPYQESIERYKELLMTHSYMSVEEYRDSVFTAIEEGIDSMYQLPVKQSWQDLSTEKASNSEKNYEAKIIEPIKKRQGNSISTHDIIEAKMIDGSIPMGKTEFLNITSVEELPCWNSSQCYQCNLCATVCPHGVIRPFVHSVESGEGNYRKNTDYDYSIEVNYEKCTGCSLCVEACPAKGKALQMREIDVRNMDIHRENWLNTVHENDNSKLISENLSLDESQFVVPLMKYSTACAGCGETPYVKLLTQLFGERLSIANATGCSSIWSATAPYAAFYQTKDQTGPVWATSLFENNSAFGYGIDLGFKIQHQKIYNLLDEIKNDRQYAVSIRRLAEEILETDGEKITSIKSFIKLIQSSSNEKLKKITDMKHYLIKRSHWLIGGDGWAYDIDFGGLDHLISKGEDCNILILDNEGYANTGGQVSKGTPIGAKVKFASKGNRFSKKDFGYYAMQFDNVFVGQISLFSHPAHAVETLKAAEEHEGVSIIISYSPCVLNKSELSAVQLSKAAVKSGYWPIFVYQNGKMELSSSPPDIDSLKHYFKAQTRFDYPEFNQEILLNYFAEAKKRYFNYTLLKEIGEIKGSERNRNE